MKGLFCHILQLSESTKHFFEVRIIQTALARVRVGEWVGERVLV